MLIDTHCHLDMPPLFLNLQEILASACKNGVGGFIVPGVDPDGWSGIRALTADRRIFAAPGIHPMRAAAWSEEVMERLSSLLSDSVAVGEIGLDYTEGMPEKELQERAFRSQLRAAKMACLPVIIHCRKAFAHTLKIIAEEKAGDFGGVMHAFSGSLETARQFIDMGLKIGIAGPVTWAEARKPKAVAAGLRLEDILLETDSPDMAPQGRRGESNDPALLVEIAEKVARLKGVLVEDVARITTQNAEKLFRLQVKK
jgi:TatD DNase family protein